MSVLARLCKQHPDRPRQMVVHDSDDEALFNALAPAEESDEQDFSHLVSCVTALGMCAVNGQSSIDLWPPHTEQRSSIASSH